jgi:predicted GIY-YIG superfamily endonuclease
MRDLSGTCYVYMLCDPETEKPFYIGIAKNPWSRFYSHCHEKWSAAWPVLQRLVEKFGQDDILKIYRECPDRRAAFDLEYKLVSSTPGLLNRPYRRARARK